jgi:hypothetical protein
MIWAPYTTSNGQWIANKLLQGFFGAPIESLCEISISDLVSFATQQFSKVKTKGGSVFHP